MRAYGAAASEHPLATHAIGEAVGDVIEQVGVEPDLAMLFVTAAHVGVIEDMVGVVREVVRPRTLVGVTAVTVIGGGREMEDVPAVSLWAGNPGPCEAVRFESITTDSGAVVTGMPDAATEGDRTLILLPDPFSFPADAFLAATMQQYPRLSVVGGLASAARGPGGNRLILDDRIYLDGGVGVLLPADAVVRSVVSQGCRPIGSPLTVTRAERNVVYELAGKPAMERLQELIDSASDEQRALMAKGLHVGIVVDEHRSEFERGDFLIRGLIGVDRSNGALAVGDTIEVGATIQFQVRDADTASEDLHLMLNGTRAKGGLLFSCNGRGSHLFEQPDHDVTAVYEETDTPAIGGMFCAGEFGPIAGRNALHGYTASVLLFDR